MGIVNNVLAGASGNQGYFLSRSLRFRASASAYLSRTPAGASNRTTWTFSAWIKRGNLGSFNTILSAGSNNFVMRYNVNGAAADGIEIYEYNGSSFVYNLGTTVQYRDPSAWYHVVFALDTTQATNTNRMKLYVNGVQVTAFSAINYPSQNATGTVNSTSLTAIGQGVGIGAYFDGYMTEINFIDGQALTPSSFGMNDPATGVWEPKKYTGTYGTNGYYLPFTDNSNNTATTIGKDFSGNGNNWTPNNISVTAGATYDSMTDVPTLTSPTAANYATFSPLVLSAYGSLTNGNLTYTGTSSANNSCSVSTIGFTTGFYYAEFTASGINGSYPVFGVVSTATLVSNPDLYLYGFPGYFSGVGYRATGEKVTPGPVVSAYGSTFTTNDVIGVAVDATNGAVYFSKNGVWQNSGVPTSGASKTGAAYTYTGGSLELVFAASVYVSSSSINANFGQRPFAYTPPSGFVALNTFNLPTPTIGATPSSQANKYFDATTYTGNGTSLAVTNSGSMQPDFLWIKQRGGATSHVLQDSVRGAGKSLFSNATAAESGNSGDLVTSFNSNGFTVNDTYLGGSGGGGTNGNSGSYIAWQWRASNATGVTNTAGSITSTVSANTTAGFSIVTYTGTGANATVGHGLGVAPKMIICKSRTNAYEWIVWHTGLTSAAYYVNLNTTNAQATASTLFQSTAPSSSVITLGTNITVNASGANQLIYCFSEVAGYSRFGSYTGNGSADGPFVFTGFRPRYVMVKSTSGSRNWAVLDTSRNPSNVANFDLYPNQSLAEITQSTLDFLSNGFKLRVTDSDFNANGETYIYMAFAENPFKYSLAR